MYPVAAESFEGLPPAYIETAEFDCLHDDGILYAHLLRGSGIEVTLNEVTGTIKSAHDTGRHGTADRLYEIDGLNHDGSRK